jgi:hypothetical protein
MGRLASLNRFISRSAERSLSFFEILNLVEVFQWGPTQQQAFEELKDYLIKLTTLSPPSPGASLLIYVSSPQTTMNAALVQEVVDEGVKGQMLVYFCVRSVGPVQKKLHKDGKCHVCSLDGFKKASALFSVL